MKEGASKQARVVVSAMAAMTVTMSVRRPASKQGHTQQQCQQQQWQQHCGDTNNSGSGNTDDGGSIMTVVV